jgi:GT2 family glycosyltransferase
MRASVVIPTFNRLPDLRRVVAAVRGQPRPPEVEVEVVVVDDGSSDGTWAWLSNEAETHEVRAVRQDNSGPARARNLGADTARGDIVLFLGDDTVPEPEWLLCHLEEHRLFGGDGATAVLGYTSFPPDTDSPFRVFINEWGAQFGYLLIEDPCSVPFNFFYTSNISLSRDFFLASGGFREDFPAAAWEDIEFAYRGSRNGLSIRYQPRARVVHHHCVLPRTFCRRQRTSGRSAAIFAGLHPELSHFLGVERVKSHGRPGRFRHLALWLVVELGERIPGLVPNRMYENFLDACYWVGLAEGLHQS